ncbi:signal peptide peptidase SppA [Candidatus Woesearchaeota archaeon]|nr:signal peptide peptidase SppA [Candidatus Woesearchaeota archaeon]
MAKKEVQKRSKWKSIIIILVTLFIISWLFSSVISSFLGADTGLRGNVALIPIKGTITIEGISSFGEKGTSSTEVIEYIKDADANPSIKAILFEINSPGGSAVASKEIADAVSRTNKTTYALIREVGASGAYWIASSTDHIIANELSITGSIGVIASYIEFAGLLERYNMSYQRLVAGQYKDLGTPFKYLPDDEKEILQDKLNKIHDYFIESVAENRDMPVEKLKEIATGEFYLGSEALELGLIDSFGDKETAVELIKQQLNLTEVEFAEYKRPKTFIESLLGAFSENFFFIGKGIGSALTEQKTTNRLEIFT